MAQRGVGLRLKGLSKEEPTRDCGRVLNSHAVTGMILIDTEVQVGLVSSGLLNMEDQSCDLVSR